MSTDKPIVLYPQLDAAFDLKYQTVDGLGWGPRQRLEFKYYNPDDIYEAALAGLIRENTRWLDIGCGRFVFPSNPKLAKLLAERCRLLVGLDPDETIEENEYVHQKYRCTFDEFESTQTFDVISLRMVAEHIAEPEATVDKIWSLTRPGAKIIVYTINKYSPVPILTKLLPFSGHHTIKAVLWGTEEKDTFPVQYRMNTKRALEGVFDGQRFRFLMFDYLADCTIFARFRRLNYCELIIMSMFRKLRLPYPENCILAVIERLG